MQLQLSFNSTLYGVGGLWYVSYNQVLAELVIWFLSPFYITMVVSCEPKWWCQTLQQLRDLVFIEWMFFFHTISFLFFF